MNFERANSVRRSNRFEVTTFYYIVYRLFYEEQKISPGNGTVQVTRHNRIFIHYWRSRNHEAPAKFMLTIPNQK
uniref:Uncharacterized protein n=1 Tax=Romanomermis culicivorax TaxID=13658 RepID=A0A915KK77_ROMCU